MQKRYTERFKSFCDSLDSLEELKTRDLSDSFVISGGVQKFSLTFDIAWKVMKDIVTHYHQMTGFPTGSPRECLKAAMRCGVITEDIWMQMLRERNELTHDYDGKQAEEAVYRIRDEYLPVFEKFRNTAAWYMKKMENTEPGRNNL